MPPPVPFVTTCLNASADAVRFFTRLPLPSRFGAAGPGPIFDGVAAAAPLAGVIVGAVSGATLAALLALGLPPLAASVFAIAAAVALTGALHEDALADAADGFGGGRTVEAKLAIMRDSQLGSYGASALTLGLLARVALVAALAERLGPAAAFALIAAAAIARPLALLPTRLLAPARADGAAFAAQPGATAVGVGCALGAVAVLALAGPLPGLLALAPAIAATLGVTALARRQIGGVTGDVCGTAAHLAEIAALAGLTVAYALT